MITTEPLPYAFDALEPYISYHQLYVHYHSHYKKYVEKVNKAVEGTALEDVDLDILMRLAGNELQANALQVWNHQFFWDSMVPDGCDIPQTLSQLAIDSYGSLEHFKKAFEDLTDEFFGSGWVWLIKTDSGDVKWVTTKDADNPLDEQTPLLCCDLWEHSYYLSYESDRKDYLLDWYENLANWEFALANLDDSQGKVSSLSKYSSVDNQGYSMARSITHQAAEELRKGQRSQEFFKKLLISKVRVIMPYHTTSI